MCTCIGERMERVSDDPLVIGYTCAPPTPSWTTAEMRRWRLTSAGRSIGWKRRGAWTRMSRPRHGPGTVGE
jgi:hypothetical protein